MKKVILPLVVVLLLVSLYIAYKKGSFTAAPVACTQEAKICPDGSSVGRVGPQCEFAECPNSGLTATTTPVDTGASNIKIVDDKKIGLEYSYTDNFYNADNKLTQYVHPVEWPPTVEAATSTLVCKNSGNTIQANGKTESKKINGSNYCITTAAEGAAGSTYTTYTYKKQVDKKVVTVSFVTRVPQCMNYDEPNQTACKTEVANFSIDNLVDSIFASVKTI